MGKGEETKKDFKDILSQCEDKIQKLDTNFKDIIGELNEMHYYVNVEKQHFDALVDMAEKQVSFTSDVVKINVGGTIFSTLKSTLEQKIKKPKKDNEDNEDNSDNGDNDDNDEYYEPNLLELLVSGLVKPVFDEQNAIFIDRDCEYFRYILDYLRTIKNGKEFNISKLNNIDHNKLLEEVEFYKLDGLKELLNSDKKLTCDSAILNKDLLNKLMNLCQLGNKKLNLIFRGSSNGFSSNYFHSCCDGVTNTLTVVKTTSGYIFGGFTSVAWDSSGSFKSDDKSYIFSLVNSQNKPLKIKCTNKSHSIYCHPNYMSVFGGGHDFYIPSGCNSNSSSYSNLGHSYSVDGCSQSTLAGAYNFQVSEIEVFRV